ncbi:MAG: gamma-glutamyltransferase, partial [Hyphomicrobiaceae bacterium]
DTVYLSVVDERGMAVSFINSLYGDFGAGMTTRKTGVVFHNRGQGFVLDPKHPNCIAPRKRPLHTLVPALALKDGTLRLSFGVMGAAFQPIGHAYVLTNMLDYDLDPQEALDRPRVFFEGDKVLVEESIPAEVRAGLAARGHTVAVRAAPWGGGQIVAWDQDNGVLIGASDARKDGCALGY